MTRAAAWLRSNARHAPAAAAVPAVAVVFLAVWLVVRSLVLTIVLGSLLAGVLAVVWTAIVFVTVDVRPIAREAAAKRVGVSVPPKPVRAYEVEPAHRAVPQLPASTYVMEPVPAYPIDVDDDAVTIPMPPPPAPVVAAKVDPTTPGALLWPLLKTMRVDFTQPVPVGFDAEGNVEHVTFTERNLLLGGETGGGKSNIVQILTAAAALDPNVELYLFDAKRVELYMWRNCAVRFVQNDTEEANAVLEGLLADMDKRYLFMQRNGLRKLLPTSDFPMKVVVIDELAEFTDDKTRSDPEDNRSATLGSIFVDHATRVASLGRAAGLVLIAATQEPRYDVVKPKLRNKFVFRWALRCQRPTQVNTILGDGWLEEAPAHRIRGDEKGVGYLLHEGAKPNRLHAFYLTDSDIRDIAERAEAGRRTIASDHRFGTASTTTSLPLQWPVPKWTSDAHEAARSAPEVVSEAVKKALDAGWSPFRVVRDVLGWPASGDALSWHKAVVVAIGEVRGPRLQVVRDAVKAGEEEA